MPRPGSVFGQEHARLDARAVREGALATAGEPLGTGNISEMGEIRLHAAMLPPTDG